MKINKIFSSENFLMSVAGHLLLLSLMTISFVFIGGAPEQIIAQNRIQIMEIDLTKIEIAKDTVLYNTESETRDQKPETSKEEPEEIGDEEEITKQTTQNSELRTQNSSTAVPSKRTVRVNRETRGLDRTMTISVVDALRVALTRCWTIDNTRPGLEQLRVVSRLTMYKNGMIRDVWFEGGTRADSDPEFAYVVGTIRDALNNCQPFKMLPENTFEEWEKIILTFYPSNKSIM